MRCTIGLALLGLALGAGDARTQQALAAGQRVRLTSAQYRLNLKVATLIAVDDSAISVALTKYWTVNPRDPGFTDTVALSRAGIDRLEVSQGRTSGTGTGALIGLVSGTVAGGILAAATYKGRECGPPDPRLGSRSICISPPYSRGGATMTGAATLGLIGAGIGALIGSASHGDRWEPAVTVRSLPASGAGLGLGVRF